MKTPEDYKKLLNSSYKSFNLGLEEISHSYPLFKLYPDNSSYKREHTRDVQNLEKIKKNIFINKNNLQSDSETITKNISKTNKKITELNKSNNILTNKLNALENQNSAASGELIDKKYIYNIYLAQNIILAIIMAGSIGLYIKGHYAL